MPLTDDQGVVAQALVDLVRKDWSNIGFPTKDDIYYGDQERYPRFPSLAVEPAPTERQLYQTGLQEKIDFTMYLLLFHGPIATTSDRRKETDTLAQSVVDQLHTDRKLGGLVVHGHPTNVEPGFFARGGAMLVAHRITWTGTSRHLMPAS